VKYQIYLADDQENIRNLMQLFLVNGGYEVETFRTGDELLKGFRERPCDLVILDIMMPGTDGLSLCRQLREEGNPFIVIVSARDSESDRIAGITLGSDDYLTKPFSPLELVARVNALFRRRDHGRDGAPEILSFTNFQINTAFRQAFVDGNPHDLTPTEYALMVYLMQNRSRAVSREELLKNVWNFDFDADTRATDDVIKRLRKKLSSSGAKLSIETVRGYGFKLSAEETYENA